MSQTTQPLLDRITGLLCLSIKERGYLNSYEINTCGEKLQEIISYVSDPAGKLQRTLPKVLGQLAPSQHKIMLQATANQKWLAQLQNSYHAVQRENSSLWHDIPARKDETSRTWEDWLAFNRQLKSKLHLGRPPQSIWGSHTLDSHPAPPAARLMDTGAPLQGGVPQSSRSCATICCDTVTPPQREQGYHCVRNSITGSGPPFTSICMHIAVHTRLLKGLHPHRKGGPPFWSL